MKPHVEDAPGLVWQPRGDEWKAIWRARDDLISRGFTPKNHPLWQGIEPTAVDIAHIQDTCNRLQGEMLAFSRGLAPVINAFDGTLKTLIGCYQTDPDSPYQANRYHTRKNRDGKLKRISERHGHEELCDIKARVLKAWHKEWSHDSTKLATGSSIIGQLRALFSFGATLLEDPDCERLCSVMHKMRFPGTKHRDVSVTADQADAIRHRAREQFGWDSMALGQAFQFECTLRQKDVIGEWVPVSEDGISAVVVDGEKWLRGIVWQEINDNLILKHVTSKKQKLTEVDLKLAPMVMDELQRMVGAELLTVVDATTKKVTVNRHLLPASGAIVLNEINGFPWTDSEYRRKWRKVARSLGIPDNVKNMDSRSGAISEGIDAGATLEMVRHTATHSDISQTADYDRGQAKATAKVMRLRVENRNKPKTD